MYFLGIPSRAAALPFPANGPGWSSACSLLELIKAHTSVWKQHPRTIRIPMRSDEIPPFSRLDQGRSRHCLVVSQQSSIGRTILGHLCRL
jgi:hypothetical protein